MQFHVPDDVSWEAACTVGVGLHTLSWALYRILGLPWPDSTATTTNSEEGGKEERARGGKDVLIYGGSTATGTLAIQFAKLYVILSAQPDVLS